MFFVACVFQEKRSTLLFNVYSWASNHGACFADVFNRAYFVFTLWREITFSAFDVAQNNKC